MRKSGEYIYGIYPGPDTSRFLNRLVMRFAVIGAVYTKFDGGRPHVGRLNGSTISTIKYDSRYVSDF